MIGSVPVLLVASVKGGAGKTTCSVHLAEAAEVAGIKALVVDSDPQQSAASWYGEAQEAGAPLRSSCLEAPTKELAHLVSDRAVRLKPGLIVIDSPNRDLDILRAALQVADLVVIPTAPTTMELPRVWPMVDLAEEAGREAWVLINKADSRSPGATATARELLREGEARICQHAIPYRQIYAQARAGRPSAWRLNPFSAVLEELWPAAKLLEVVG